MSFLSKIIHTLRPQQSQETVEVLSAESSPDDIQAWLKSLKSSGKTLPLTQSFSWKVTGGNHVGSLLAWAIERESEPLVSYLLKEGFNPNQRGGFLDIEGSLRAYWMLSPASSRYQNCKRIFETLIRGGLEVTLGILETQIWNSSPLLKVSLLHVDASKLRPTLARTAASIGASDTIIQALLDAGMRFEIEDVTTNICFMESAGSRDDIKKRHQRWIHLQAQATAAALETTFPKAQTPDKPRRRL